MKTVRFTYPHPTGGYGCSEPGDRSGEYVEAGLARALLAELRHAEWGGTADNQSARLPAKAASCPCCGGLNPAYPWLSQFPRATVGHATGCSLAAAIAQAEGAS